MTCSQEGKTLLLEFGHFPEGDLPSSPGLLYSATLGKTASELPNPTEVVANLRRVPNRDEFVPNRSRLLSSRFRREVRPQPRWGWGTRRQLSQGSRVQQPWAGGRIPFGENVQTLEEGKTP